MGRKEESKDHESKNDQGHIARDPGEKKEKQILKKLMELLRTSLEEMLNQ